MAIQRLHTYLKGFTYVGSVAMQWACFGDITVSYHFKKGVGIYLSVLKTMPTAHHAQLV